MGGHTREGRRERLRTGLALREDWEGRGAPLGLSSTSLRSRLPIAPLRALHSRQASSNSALKRFIPLAVCHLE